MQSESKKYEEETPSLHWGMDPVFSAFARLYIKDIKEMRESKQVPGIFFYNGHPVRQVDVFGIVVQMKERDAFYNYGVDDSTGVINCVCWKNPMIAETSLSGHPSTPSSVTVLEQMKKLQEMVSQKTKLEIGDVVRVRGHIRTYRQQREIQTSCFYKVDDPVCDVQISRMLELPCLYREVYDKPFQGPEEGQSDLEGQNFSINMLHEKVKGFLLENKIQTFYQQELETIDTLVPLAGVHLPSRSCQEVKSKSDSSSKRIHSVFKEAIRMLQEKGLVFQKPSSSKDLYHVTDHDKELLKVTLDVIKEDCRKPRHAEKGCHFLHVLSCVRQSYNPSLAEVVMHRVLELLESNSDVVSTMEGYYMAF
ncbi:CST complex subunit STN1 isoform X1 [Aquila chrysaetos chrysaetos]|uniref:CST complex subunit STN1 n=1 Tax=Aquila chrysaetos chrysaetos TaxID=223781 RepID=A0A663EK50_AQUCH|nr:CST complex subunit STN1 isoform X1 [Aquila chrysaetos chrysaetos]XP_029885616.1 CST complex subunit STN1 isoform X1 [Aquila chrysaetos chrysaetos]XP_029885617.1 CST complex subunit STN1 isoform X1 [Aquila chrysaetos chrysaetos]XP_040983052.1 CST complex subunit STN1 isoform X1 [Aquila chrysaetos chrysaetos]XP_040983053.1 CST complex subunit STN1 isoform X1 [Aquila chrysaetos chrysaetos]